MGQTDEGGYTGARGRDPGEAARTDGGEPDVFLSHNLILSTPILELWLERTLTKRT
jgi:hypothetical protein